jgi:hypothetical protein
MPAHAGIQYSEAVKFDVEAALTKPSLPGVAVRRTASLSARLCQAIHRSCKMRFLKMDARVKKMQKIPVGSLRMTSPVAVTSPAA